MNGLEPVSVSGEGVPGRWLQAGAGVSEERDVSQH